MSQPAPDPTSRIGLCANCRFSRTIENRRGSLFYLCLRSETDPRFRKYPPLPVISCAGYEAGEQVAETQRRAEAS